MKDRLWKLKVLFFSISYSFKHWKESVWDVELDELYCCNGRDCGCQAVTNRQYISWQFQVDVPPPTPTKIDFN